MLSVLAHHRSEGQQFLSPGQEEALVIGAFGLAWLAMLITFRVFRQRTGGAYDMPPPQYQQPEANHAAFRTVATPVAQAMHAAGRHVQEHAQAQAYAAPPPPPVPVQGRAPYAAAPPPQQHYYAQAGYAGGYNRRYGQGYDGGRGFPVEYGYW